MKSRLDKRSMIFRSAFFVLLLMLVFSVSSSYFTEEDTRGRVSQVDGRVKKRSTLSENWEDALVNTDVGGGDEVRTYRQSRAELELTELDLVRMAPQTRIVVKKLYEEKKARKRELSIDVEEGDIWANVGGNTGNLDFQIKTPRAAAAITGTVFRLGIDADSTTQFKVYKGEVRVTNAPHRTDLQPKLINPQEVPGPYEIPGPQEVSLNEWLYIVKNMQQISIDNNGKVTKTGTFKEDDADEQIDWVKWNIAQDRRWDRLIRQR